MCHILHPLPPTRNKLNSASGRSSGVGNSGGKARCASERGLDLLRFELCTFSGAGNTSMCIFPFPWSFFSCFPSSPALEGQNVVWEVEQEVNSCPRDRNSLFSSHTCPLSFLRIHIQLPALHRASFWGDGENIASGSASCQGRGGTHPCFPREQSCVFPGEKAVFSLGAAVKFRRTPLSLRGSRCRMWGLLRQGKIK